MPVELNGLVYQALQSIPTLRNLGVLLGGSPLNMSFQQTYANNAFPPNNIGGANAVQAPVGTILSATPNATNAYGNGPSWSKRSLPKSNGRYDYWKDRRTLSRFTGLKELTLKEISDLDCLEEIAGCLRASSASLKQLTLSLSLELAVKSRKPPAATPAADDASDADQTESEDELALPPVNSQTVQAAGSTDTRKDKIAQEAILARVFSLQDVASEGRRLEKDLALSKPLARPKGSNQALYALVPIFLDTIERTVKDPIEKKRLETETFKFFAGLISDTGTELLMSIMDRVPSISGSSSLPLSAVPLQSPPSTTPPPYALAGPSSTAGLFTTYSTQGNGSLPVPHAGLGDPAIWAAIPTDQKQLMVDSLLGVSSGPHQTGQSLQDQPIVPTASTTGPSANESPETGITTSHLFDPQDQWKPKNTNDDYMDIDMDHPDESTVDTGPDQEVENDENKEELGNDVRNVLSDTSFSSSEAPRKRAKLESVLSPRVIAVGESSKGQPGSQPVKGKERETTVAVNPGDAHRKEDTEESMQEYIRATHGLQLETFALYLIPLKASIVARALDLNVLKHITLLDVGPQTPFWQLLERLSKSTPQIGFETIHTDDVSNAFLSFLSATSPTVKELYLLKRKKRDPEPPSMTAAVHANLIFTHGLRKQLKTLTHLMLRNEHDDLWDVDEALVRMLSLKCKGLVELGISMKLKALVRHLPLYGPLRRQGILTYTRPKHTLTQNISRFSSLRVLHFINLRTGGSSHPASTVETDTASFISDTMTYVPDRKLRYIAVGERYATIETPAEISKRCKMLAEKHKKARRGLRQMAKSKQPAHGVKINEEEDSWDETAYEYAEVSRDLLLM